MPRLPRPRHQSHRHAPTRSRRHRGGVQPLESLEARQLLSVDLWPSAGANGSASVVVADFNRDGRGDVAQVGPTTDGLSIKLGQADGTLTEWRTYLTGTPFDSVAAGDFDGDGKLDLAIVRPRREGGSNTGLVAILLGRGDGQFTLNSTSPDDRDPSALVAADFDGDGKLDLVTANATGGVSLRPGRGDGTFASPTFWGNVPTPIVQLAVGDISGDGQPDVVASGGASGRLAVLINHGPGQLPAIVTTNVDGAPGFLTLGDVDRDGHLDVVATDASWGAAHPSVLSVYRNVGFNTFESYGHFRSTVAASALAFAGSTGDGTPQVSQLAASLSTTTATLPRPYLRGLSVPNQTFVLDPQMAARDKLVRLTIPETSPGTGGPVRLASVDWGDGPTGPYAVTATGPSTDVTSWSGFSYPSAGVHTLGVVVQDSSWYDELGRAAGTLTVVRAIDLRGSTATIAAREGELLRGVTVASFGAPRPDAAASQFDVSINWGDGQGPLPGSLRTVAFPDATDPNTGTIVPGFTLFQVQGWHTYDRPGGDSITISVTDRVTGLTRTAAASAQVAGWPLLLRDPEAPITATAGTPMAPATLALIEQSGNHGPDDYQTSIDWGDDHSSAGSVTRKSSSLPEAPYPTTTFAIVTGHTYLTAGTYTYTVNVTGRDGETARRTGTIAVAAAPVIDPPPIDPSAIPLTAKLDPASDSGASNSDGITNVKSPRFVGTANPGTTVTISGVRLTGGNGPIVLGSATADAQGRWTLTPAPLADGHYTLGVTVRESSGAPVASIGLPDLVIDTMAPRVVGATLVTKKAGGVLIFWDGLSGLDPATLGSAGTYSLVKKVGKKPGPVHGGTSVSVGEATPIGTRAVTLAFSTAGKLKSAAYTIGTLPNTISDLAGNVLDGEYRGTFPSGGTSHPGNSFVARFNVDARGRSSGPLEASPSPVKPRRRNR